MTEETQREFIKNNQELIQKFLEESKPHEDEISASIQGTIAQFLLNTRIEFNKRINGQEWISTEDIIQAQITVLRRCIVDLERYHSTLWERKTVQ
jgi:tRNA splicing ligase